MRIANIIKLVLSLAIPLAVGAIAGAFTAEAIPEWYTSLNKPFFNPPNWLFAPVWTTLYIIMGISFFMVWKQPPGSVRNMAMISFCIQLFLNFGYTLSALGKLCYPAKCRILLSQLAVHSFTRRHQLLTDKRGTLKGVSG